MIKKQIIVFTLVLLACFGFTFAQETLIPFHGYFPLKVTEDKKPVYYSKRMNNYQKNDMYSEALLYAFYLKKYGKKRHLKKADQFLAEHFDANIESIEKMLNDLEISTQSFSNEVSAQEADKLESKYQNMLSLKSIVEELGESYQIKDFSQQLELAKERKKDYYKKTAQMYYEQVVKGRAQASSKATYRLMANKLTRARRYDNRKDIIDLYEEIKVLATTRLGVGIIQNKISSSSLSISRLRDYLHNDIRYHTSKEEVHLPYFKLMDNNIAMTSSGSDILIEVTLLDMGVETSVDDPSTDEISRSEGKGDEKQTFTGNWTTYSKRAEATVNASYRLKDTRTGKVIRSNTVSGTYTWVTYWYSFSGDRRALKKGQKNKLEQKQEAYPPRSELLEPGANTTLGNITEDILDYIDTIGK